MYLQQTGGKPRETCLRMIHSKHLQSGEIQIGRSLPSSFGRQQHAPNRRDMATRLLLTTVHRVGGAAGARRRQASLLL